MNITAPIRSVAYLRPEKAAILCGDGTAVSYAQLEGTIDRLARVANELGLRAGDIVGLSLVGPMPEPALVLALALARIGVAWAPQSLSAEHLRLRFVAGQCQEPRCVGFDESWLTAVDADEAAAVPMHLDPDTMCAILAAHPASRRPASATARLVVVSHGAMIRRVRQMEHGMAGDSAGFALAADLDSAEGVETMLRTLWAGGTVGFKTYAMARAEAMQRRRMADPVGIDASPYA